ncbi:hypothetical protein [Synechococcus sp. PCC 7502]|uniref:hypothetical protein n=1 Tax=Synechococcus sp. PCC 7502 TaxID=1173263 RepID=UPI001AEF9CC9|nr:hypothetical protein [Synechococcus sp. PCC 7502]
MAATLAAFSSVLASPSFAEPSYTFNSLMSDQDVYPVNLPYTYNAAQTLVLDLSSDGFIAQPYIQFDYPDLVAERQLNGFRSIIREMYERQSLDTPTIRTRDLPSAYTTALSESCGYYLVTGAAYPITGTPNATECTPPAPVSVAPEPPAPTPAPQPVAPPRPVPALW